MKYRLVRKGQDFKIYYLILFSFLNSFALYADSKADQHVFRLQEGESITVPGTEIKIFVKSVIDLTSSGCMGGPIGCRDQVTIEIKSGKDAVEAVLEIARTADQKKRKIDQTSVHGKTIRFIRLNKKEVELVVEDSLKNEKHY